MRNPVMMLRIVGCLLRKAKGLIRSLRIWIECLVLKRWLIVIHIQEIGLKEHVEPIISWLMRTARCSLLVVAPKSQMKSYRALTTIPYGKTPFLQLVSEEEFSMLASRPKVALSFHPETPSLVARSLAKTACCRIVMQHGLSDKGVFDIKGSSIKDPLADYDVVFLAGPLFREGSLQRYAKQNRETFLRLKFIEVGLPKTDALFHPQPPRGEFLKKMKLNPKRPVVCYAPTFEMTASLEQQGLKIMPALARLKVNVIVKLHHLSLKRSEDKQSIVHETEGKNWRKIVQNLEQEYPNLKLARGQDANPYLSVSDVLVSDASGVAYEFLLLNRPIIFFDVPDLFKEYGKDGIHYWGRECGDVVANVDELVAAVRFALENPNDKKKERQKMIRRVVYSKGKATETAGQAILTLAERGRF